MNSLSLFLKLQTLTATLERLICKVHLDMRPNSITTQL